MMSSVKLELGEDLLFFLRQIDAPVEKTARECIILELYRRHLISSGRAAELLAMGRIAFIEYSGKLGIPFFDMSPEEWQEELQTLERLWPHSTPSAIPAPSSGSSASDT